MRMNGRSFAKKWMGKTVEVTHLFRIKFSRSRTFETVRPSVQELQTPRKGWVVGYTYRCDRVRINGDGTPFCSGKRRLVYLVCFWPGKPPEDIPPEGVRLCDSAPTCTPDWQFNGHEKIRAEYRSYAAELPRDERGRWLSLLPKQEK